MDLYGALRELYEEKKRLDQTISALEASLQRKTAPAPKRRGRKTMSAEERQQVSERMRKYWEARKQPAPEGAATAATAATEMAGPPPAESGAQQQAREAAH